MKHNILSVIGNRSLSLLLVAVLAGCSITADPLPDDPEYAPIVTSSAVVPSPNRGGIYQPDFSVALFEDRRASRVGDILSIILSERTQSSKTADTEITKDNTVTMNSGVVAGVIPSFGEYNLATDITQDPTR